MHEPHAELEVTATSLVDTSDPPTSLAAPGVQTSALQAWQLGQDVGQDIALVTLVTLVTLALLRAAGVPARYVSGYLHPQPEPVLGEVVAGESPAWVEAWLGNWWPFDPTNDLPVGSGTSRLPAGGTTGTCRHPRASTPAAVRSSLSVRVEVTPLACPALPRPNSGAILTKLSPHSACRRPDRQDRRVQGSAPARS